MERSLKNIILSNLKAPFKVQDHAVSNEIFELKYDENLEILYTSPQIKEEDLGKYYESSNYISHTDSQATFIDLIYQKAKSFMLKRKVNYVSEFKPRGKLLDIGAGTGDFLAAAQKEGFTTCGIEPNDKARSIAAQKSIILKKDIASTDGKYDVISMWHVLEHVPDYNKQIKWLHSHLKTDGILFIAVPNFKSYDAKIYKENWAAYDVPRHLHHFSQNGIQKIFAAHGFEIVKKRPLLLDAFYVSILSEKYKGSSLAFLKGLFAGTLSNIVAIKNSEYSSLLYILKKQNADF